MNLTELACKMKIFAGLSPDEVNNVIKRLGGVMMTYHKNDIVVSAGSKADQLLAVASGHLHVYTKFEGAHPMLVREIVHDEVLGLWMHHVPEVTCWPGTVVAAEDCVLIAFNIERTHKLMSSSSPTVTRILANTAEILARELFSTWRKLMVMNTPTIENRIMAYLYELDNESGNAGVIVVPFNREQMAEFLGVTRPTLSRAIGRLRDRGLISWRKNIFYLKGKNTNGKHL